MSEASMFLQRVRDLALSMKDQTLLESIIRSQELLLKAGDEIIVGGTVNYGQILILSLQLWRYCYQMSF